MKQESVIIGKIRIAKGTQFKQSYETASWYKTMTMDKDIDVDIHAVINKDEGGCREGYKLLRLGKVADRSVSYSVNGVCDGSDFTSLWGGSQIGASKVNEDVGTEMKYYCNPYAHSVASSIVNSPFKTNIRLNSEFRARKSYFWSTLDNAIKNSYRIYLKEQDICGNLMENPEFSEYIFDSAKEVNGKVFAVILNSNDEEYVLVEVIGNDISIIESAPFDSYDSVERKGNYEGSTVIYQKFIDVQ